MHTFVLCFASLLSLTEIPYMAKYWWGKILANLVNRRHVAKIDPTKILPLDAEFIVLVIIISCKHGSFVEILFS